MGLFGQWRKPMKHVRKAVIAASAFTCAVLFSFGWSQQEGISLSVESAQARIGRPLTPMSVAGVARRQNRRAAYGYGAGWRDSQPYWGARSYVGGYGVAGAAAVGTAGGAWGSQAYYAPTANPSGWYISPNGMACTSGTLVTGANGLPFRCP